MEPFAPGDSEAMRSMATGLRSHAERLVVGSERIRAHLDRLEYEGPAAERLRSATVERHQRVVRTASRLQDFANQLLRRANALEDEWVTRAGQEDPGCR